MGAVGDLTTLATVKAWRSPPIVTTGDDAQIARIITAASDFIIRYLQRRLVSQRYSETRNGMAGAAMMLRHAPVSALASLSIDGCVIPPAPDATGPGWVLDGENGMVYLRGHGFARGVQNVAVNYTAGFLVVDEPQTVPASSPYQLNCAGLTRLWAADSGVAYEAGGALVPVAPGATPATGQYLPPTAPDGFYGFAAADAGRAVLVSYSFTPRDVEQACVELALLRLNERGRIGEVSKTLTGEVISFVQRDLTASIVTTLQPYRRVVPVL